MDRQTADERWTRPVPRPSEISRPFWDACREHVLQVQRCRACRAWVFLPQSFCPQCLGTELDWTPVSGTGSVVTYTVVWRPQTPAFEVPYVIAVVQLDEGVDLLTNLTGVDAEAVSIGLRVGVRFVDVTSGATLPFFAPLEDGRA